ncbi:hypothetical protein [Actinomadura sp. NPDC049753]|uniref:hypothetical protein n=1 Tax=Actinomadura sp. NPDC049753 TaxID=3154739 RepID=UPI003428995F
MEPAKLSREDIALLLRALCIDLGFCLSREDHDALCDSPPSDVDGFTDAVFRAEGLDASPHTHLYGQVRETVARAFGNGAGV